MNEQFVDMHLEMRAARLGLDFSNFDATISSTGEMGSRRGGGGGGGAVGQGRMYWGCVQGAGTSQHTPSAATHVGLPRAMKQ